MNHARLLVSLLAAITLIALALLCAQSGDGLRAALCVAALLVIVFNAGTPDGPSGYV